MPKRTESVAVDPATSEIQRLTGLRIRAIRKLAGLKQALVAEQCGADQSQWSRWERGDRIPDPLVMLRFAARARASLDLIYRGMPGGAHPTLVRLLQAAHPDLMAPDPTGMDQDTDTALTSYRNSIRQTQEAGSLRV